MQGAVRSPRPPILTQKPNAPQQTSLSLHTHTHTHTSCQHQECARYLELFKAYEQKPADAIQARTDTDYVGRLTSALTSVRGVNRNDAYTIGATFGTLADAFRGGLAQFSGCPGLGPVKARRLHDAFSQPFRRTLVQGGGAAGAGGAGATAAAAAAAGPSAAGPSAAGPSARGAAGGSQPEAAVDAAAAAVQQLHQQQTQGAVAVQLPISDDEAAFSEDLDEG